MPTFLLIKLIIAITIITNISICIIYIFNLTIGVSILTKMAIHLIINIATIDGYFLLAVIITPIVVGCVN